MNYYFLMPIIDLINYIEAGDLSRVYPTSHPMAVWTGPNPEKGFYKGL